jgi:riboflavin kinase/FMN adenylyltransferase
MSKLFREVTGENLCPQGSVVCIGAFDGLHRGHQALVGHARLRARELRLPAVALSFEPLPREYFARGERPARLTLPRAKFEGLAALGMDRVGLLRFGAALSSMSADEFVERILLARLSAREVWVGPDFRYGKGRAGHIESLREAGARLGFAAGEIAPVVVDGERVSARACANSWPRAISRAPRAGSAAATPSTARWCAVRQLGRRLGYPDREPAADGQAHGAHRHLRHLGARRGRGRARQRFQPGHAPDVYGTEPLLEAHLFDFDGDLYGKRLRVEFVAKLREEEKFDDLPALVRQMNLDAEQARKVLRQDRTPIGASA